MAALSGQVAIVTGGGRGIGRAIACALAVEGAAVAVTARTVEQLDETVRAIEAAGGTALAVPADVSDAGSVAAMIEEVERRLGPVDLLVNNAGWIGPVMPVWQIDPEEWRRCVDTNLFGTFLCTRAVLPGMIARKRGRIVNLGGSVPASAAPPFGSCYDSTKAAIIRFTESLAAESKEHGITAFMLMPGGVHTAMSEELARSPWWLTVDPEAGNFETHWTMPPERAAGICVFLASGKGDTLSGRYFSVHQEPEKRASRAGEILKNDLNVFRVRI